MHYRRPGANLIRKARGHCLCEKVQDFEAIKDVVIFRYLPRSWLVSKDVIEESRVHPRIEDDDDEDEIMVDDRRTERTATLRRQREARNIRVI